MVKLPSPLTTRTRAPIISVPPVAPKRHSASQRATPPLPRTPASPCSVRTGNRGRLLSLDVHQDPHFHLSAPRQTSTSPRPITYTQALLIVGKQEVRRKTARSQEDQGCPLTAHKAVLITFEPSTKVLFSRAFTASCKVGAGSEQPDVRKTAVGRLALRCYGSVRGGGVFDSGRQHVQGHRKGGEPRDQDPKEQTDHQEGSAPPRAACPDSVAPSRAGARFR